MILPKNNIQHNQQTMLNETIPEDIPSKMPFSIVTGHSDLIRDEHTKVILNTNIAEYENYKKNKEIKDKEFKRIQNLENDIDSVKNDLSEIKMLLRNLLNGSY